MLSVIRSNVSNTLSDKIYNEDFIRQHVIFHFLFHRNIPTSRMNCVFLIDFANSYMKIYFVNKSCKADIQKPICFIFGKNFFLLM
jgi:hypothetical protein